MVNGIKHAINHQHMAGLWLLLIDIKGKWVADDLNGSENCHFDIAGKAMSSLAPQDFSFLGGSSRTPLGKQWWDNVGDFLDLLIGLEDLGVALKLMNETHLPLPPREDFGTDRQAPASRAVWWCLMYYKNHNHHIPIYPGPTLAIRTPLFMGTLRDLPKPPSHVIEPNSVRCMALLPSQHMEAGEMALK